MELFTFSNFGLLQKVLLHTRFDRRKLITKVAVTFDKIKQQQEEQQQQQWRQQQRQQRQQQRQKRIW